MGETIFLPYKTILTFYKTLMFERRQITFRSLQNNAVKQVSSSICLKKRQSCYQISSMILLNFEQCELHSSIHYKA